MTSIISTVAGNGNQGYSGDGFRATKAQLNGPQGVAVDTYGNIYIADVDNHRIRMITKSTGNITTIAGGGGVDLFREVILEMVVLLQKHD